MKGRPRQRGTTLIELLVVLSLVGLIGSVIGATLLRQQRFYRGASELLHARGSVRDALEVLSTDVRGLSTADTLRLAADSAMEFFSSIGSSVVCQPISAVDFGLPGVAGPRGNTMTAMLTQPDTGDLAVFFHAGGANVPETWERARISAFAARSAAAGCPDPTGLAARTGGQAFVLTLAAPSAAAVARGTPVRFVRRGRYSLYKASDGEWYLGYRRCNAIGASSCGGIQPLSGPYKAYSANPQRTGLLFEYFDAAGGRIGAGPRSLALARVDVTARAESRQQVPVEGGISRPADSATLSIAVRNRSP